MSTMILTAEALPIFASRNWINQDSIDYGTFTVDEMLALLPRVVDGDRFSYWQGSTTDDLVTVTMQFDLMDRTALIGRAFDLVVLQNINWKNFLVEYRNPTTGVWATVTGMDFQSGVANNAETDLIVNIPAGLEADSIRIFITKTIVADEAKKCGGVIICQSVLQLSNGFLNYKVKNRESVRELELGDKTLSREYIRWSGASYDFYGSAFDCPFSTEAELELLRTIKREGFNFILILEPGHRPEETYLVCFDGPWGHAYESPVRSVGYAIPMKVKAVGSH